MTGFFLIAAVALAWLLLSLLIGCIVGRVLDPAESAPQRAVAGDDGRDSLPLSSAAVLDLDAARRARRTA